jgi:hypothetical protein
MYLTADTFLEFFLSFFWKNLPAFVLSLLLSGFGVTIKLALPVMF